MLLVQVIIVLLPSIDISFTGAAATVGSEAVKVPNRSGFIVCLQVHRYIFCSNFILVWTNRCLIYISLSVLQQTQPEHNIKRIYLNYKLLLELCFGVRGNQINALMNDSSVHMHN